jgi:hypothetical protein
MACSGSPHKAEPKKTPDEAIKERIIEELLDLKGKRRPPPLPEPSSVVPVEKPLSPAMLAFEEELDRIIERRPKYVWGGSEDESKGLDCSGMLFLAARRAGVPVRRTTAVRMAAGESGWTHIRVSRGEHDHLDTVWWTLKPGRPCGHVGVVWRDQDRVAHASSSHGATVVTPMEGKLRDNVDHFGRFGW